MEVWTMQYVTSHTASLARERRQEVGADRHEGKVATQENFSLIQPRGMWMECRQPREELEMSLREMDFLKPAASSSRDEWRAEAASCWPRRGWSSANQQRRERGSSE